MSLHKWQFFIYSIHQKSYHVLETSVFIPNQQIRKKQDLIYPKNSVMALRFDAFKNFSNFSKEDFSLKLLLSPVICKKRSVELFFESTNLKTRE